MTSDKKWLDLFCDPKHLSCVLEIARLESAIKDHLFMRFYERITKRVRRRLRALKVRSTWEVWHDPRIGWAAVAITPYPERDDYVTAYVRLEEAPQKGENRLLCGVALTGERTPSIDRKSKAIRSYLEDRDFLLTNPAWIRRMRTEVFTSRDEFYLDVASGQQVLETNMAELVVDLFEGTRSMLEEFNRLRIPKKRIKLKK